MELHEEEMRRRSVRQPASADNLPPRQPMPNLEWYYTLCDRCTMLIGVALGTPMVGQLCAECRRRIKADAEQIVRHIESQGAAARPSEEKP
jgi:hypothetical protein